MTPADLTYWPRQYVLGFLRLWRFNGPRLALRLTLCNLFGIRRVFAVRMHGFDLFLRSGTPDLAVAVDSLGGEFSRLAGFPDPAGLIIDAGGYIGTAALKLATLFPHSRIVCLEPAAENLDLLRRNVGSLPNIRVLQAALAARRGEVILHDAGSGEWGFSTTGGGKVLGAVPAVTVEDILAHETSDRLFLLKLDVEGAEQDILEAAAGWMGRTDIVIAELHEQLAPGVGAAFERATRGRINTRLPGEKVMSLRE
ncbi:MAG: FkbM family methyltransferase [Devosia sp.]|nr:FkbM family methyltransferase [Devosia sp.]